MARSEERFLVWGGGGHGKVVADAIRAAGHQLIGFIDADAAKQRQLAEPGGGRVICSEDQFLQHLQASGTLPAGATAVALAIGSNSIRHRCLRALEGMDLPVLVHPTAEVSPSATVASGTIVMARAVINADARVGSGCIINTGAIVEHDCLIGTAVHVSPGGVLAGGVRLGDRCWIGSGAVVLPQRRVGEDAVVGAGAVVVHDVEGSTVVAGNPARSIH